MVWNEAEAETQRARVTSETGNRVEHDCLPQNADSRG